MSRAVDPQTDLILTAAGMWAVHHVAGVLVVTREILEQSWNCPPFLRDNQDNREATP